MGLIKMGKEWGIDYRFPPGRAGKRIREKVGTKEDARILLGKRLQDMRHGIDPVLQRVVPVPFKVHAEEVKSRHYAMKRSGKWASGVIDTHLVPFFGDCFLSAVTPLRVKDYMTTRLAAGVCAGTVNGERAVLGKVMSLAVEWERVTKNPIRKGVVDKLEHLKVRDRVLSHAEADRLIASAPKHLKPIIVTALETGGRRKELLGLKWDSVRLDQGVLCFESHTTKNGRMRAIPITPLLDATLRELKNTLTARRGDGLEYVFTRHGKRLRDVRTAWEIARTEAELGDDVYGLHVCRHSFCTWYAEQPGANPFTLKELAGHRDMATTMRYFHGTSAARKAAVPLMGRHAGGQPVDTSKDEAGRPQSQVV